ARIHRMIGAASERLMRELIGDVDEDVKAAWRGEYHRMWPEIRPIPGACRLMRKLHDSGVAVVLASSSEQEDVDASRRALACDDAIAAATSAADVDEAKPEPGVFLAACDRVGARPATAIAIGDTLWDVVAADRAGIGCIAVRSGGVDAHALREAGALAVYEDVGELADDLRSSPLTALLTVQA
ncbi:MAG: HAD family hydrolase, partial [Actinobacteria bacterium]|nr:HAD family hydrolase [Actinomycetota bacterium]